MQTQISPHNPSFNARYRILLTTKEFEKFEKKILPKLDSMHNGHVCYLYGKSPSAGIFPEAFEHYVKMNNAGSEWGVTNLKNNGLHFDTSDTAILWLTTGAKDGNSLARFNEKCRILFPPRCYTAGLLEAFDTTDRELHLVKSVDKALGIESKDFFSYILRHPFKKMQKLDDIVKEEAKSLNITL